MLVPDSNDMQSSKPTQKGTNGECKTVMRATRSHYRELLRGPTENKRKISYVLVDYCCSTFITFQQKSPRAETTHFHELTLLMPFERITLKLETMFQHKLMLRVLHDVNTSRDIDVSFDVIRQKGTFLPNKSKVNG